MDVREVIRSSSLWFAGSIIALFVFIIFGLPTLLRILGWIFKAMGGQGLEGTGL